MAPTPQILQKTILLVDDDPQVIVFIHTLLVRQGYNVISAASGAEAVQKSREYEGEIALLLSDFQMAGMSGIELATQITVERPQLKVLMMSGFPTGMLVLNEGWHFMPKPFISSQLCALIVGLILPDSTSRFTKPTNL